MVIAVQVVQVVDGVTGPGGGGGAGGFREGKVSSDPYTASPLAANPTGLSVSAQTYPITIGGGGGAKSSNNVGASGSNSVFSTITSAGGGGGGKWTIQEVKQVVDQEEEAGHKQGQVVMEIHPQLVHRKVIMLVVV